MAKKTEFRALGRSVADASGLMSAVSQPLLVHTPCSLTGEIAQNNVTGVAR
jgi:hypothetical protein